MNDEITAYSPARSLINGNTVTAENVDKAIDAALTDLNETNDNVKIDNIIKNIIGLEKISKFALAHLLAGYETWWLNTGQDEIRGDTFQDYIESIHGLKPIVMRRYIAVWKHRDNGNFPAGVEMLPITHQIDIATKLLEEGFDPDEEQWDELLEAQNTAHLNAIIREIKGKEPTKGSYATYLERTGDIVCYHQGRRIHAGFFKRVEDADDAVERRVLEKIKSRAVNGMGLIEQ